MFVSVFWTYSKSSMSSLCRGPRPGCSTPHEASKGQSREGEKPLISDNTSFHKAQDAAGLSCCKHALLVDIRLFILWNLQVLLSRTASCDEIYFSVIPSNFCWLTSFSRSLYNSVFFFFFTELREGGWGYSFIILIFIASVGLKQFIQFIFSIDRIFMFGLISN